jgi:hypothetical protein
MWAKVVVWGGDRPASETCKTNPIWGPGAPRLRIGDCGLRIERGRVRASAGGKTCKTNPISPGGGGRRKQNAQNEPNFARPGRTPEVKCAKRTQFGGRGPRDCGLAIADCGLKEVGRGRPTYEGADRAKRTQFGPARRRAGGQMRKTNPISPPVQVDAGGKRAKRTQFGGRRPLDCRLKNVGRGRPTHSTIAQGRLYEEAKRAKRTQLGGLGQPLPARGAGS